MLLKLSLLLTIVYIFGIFLTLILFKFNFYVFFKSELSKKILMWIPITIVFLFFAMSNDAIMLIGFMLLLLGVYWEQLIIMIKKRLLPRFLFMSLIPFMIAFAHLPLIVIRQANATEVLILLAVSASLSDVGAFFFGKFFGFHKLPHLINPNKAWEGVLGQIAGAFVGTILLKLFIFPTIPLFWFVSIGIGSAIGDLFNSFVKRAAKINQWSNILPGHGGFSDRFASLAFSSLLFYYFSFFTNT